MEFKFDTQLLTEGENLSEEAIRKHITENIKRRLSYRNRWQQFDKNTLSYESWKLLEYCNGLGRIYDIVVENMEYQSENFNK